MSAAFGLGVGAGRGVAGSQASGLGGVLVPPFFGYAMRVAFIAASFAAGKLPLPMDDSKLDDLELELLPALRGSPDSRLDDLADAVGLPRTKFGRPLSARLREPISELVAAPVGSGA